MGQPALEENNNVANKFGVIDNEKRERYALWKEGRNKVHDRHSRTGIL